MEIFSLKKDAEVVVNDFQRVSECLFNQHERLEPKINDFPRILENYVKSNDWKTVSEAIEKHDEIFTSDYYKKLSESLCQSSNIIRETIAACHESTNKTLDRVAKRKASLDECLASLDAIDAHHEQIVKEKTEQLILQHEERMDQLRTTFAKKSSN